MLEVKGDIWELSKGQIICITTNGIVKKDAKAVMGAGIAKEARDRFLNLDADLGSLIYEFGNHVYYLLNRSDGKDSWELISFPTKWHWKEKSDPILIKQSVRELKKLNPFLDGVHLTNRKNIYLPRVGCGHGGLDWDKVKPLLKDLDDNYIVVSKE